MTGADAPMSRSNSAAGVVLIGGGGHARVVRFALESSGRRVVAVVAERLMQPQAWAGVTHLVDVEALRQELGALQPAGAVVAVGDNATRARLCAQLRSACPALELLAAVHPTAVVAPDVEIGAGSVVMAGAVLHPGTRIGIGVIVNTRASVDHDCWIDDYATVGPGATLGGGVRVGAYAVVGIGATVLHGRTLGEGALLAAGGVATRDLEPLAVAAGVPARVVRRRSIDEPYL